MMLVIDTCSVACQVALADETGRIIASLCEELGRGHAERLMPMIDEVLQEHGFEAVTAVTVCSGPGSFTGVRTGLAAARGLALALNCPCFGVSSFEAIAQDLHPWGGNNLCVAMDAKRGELWLQSFAPSGTALAGPTAVQVADFASHVDNGSYLAGSAAHLASNGHTILTDRSYPSLSGLAAVAIADPEGRVPAPLYLREPDAKPQG